MTWGPVEVERPHPRCVRCGGPWQGDGDPAMVACDNGHVPVWRIGETVHAVFTVFHVRWNCACGVPECKGRNVIFENDDDETDTSRYDGTQSVERFVEHSLPFTCSEEDVRAVVDAGPWEYPS